MKCMPEHGDCFTCNNPCPEVKKHRERITELEAENEELKKWQIKPTEAICLTDLSCRYKKVFKND